MNTIKIQQNFYNQHETHLWIPKLWQIQIFQEKEEGKSGKIEQKPIFATKMS